MKDWLSSGMLFLYPGVLLLNVINYEMFNHMAFTLHIKLRARILQKSNIVSHFQHYLCCLSAVIHKMWVLNNKQIMLFLGCFFYMHFFCVPTFFGRKLFISQFLILT